MEAKMWRGRVYIASKYQRRGGRSEVFLLSWGNTQPRFWAGWVDSGWWEKLPKGGEIDDLERILE